MLLESLLGACVIFVLFVLPALLCVKRMGRAIYWLRVRKKEGGE